MNYVDKNIEDEANKKENPFKAFLSAEEIEESPEDIIAKDSDTNRRELFKKAYDALLVMYPEDSKKKKKKKEKEKDALRQKVEIQLNREKSEKKQQKVRNREDKGRER